MSIQLTIMSLDFDSSGAPSTTVYYKNEITLGRGRHNDVVLDRPEVSEVHAKLRLDPQGDGAGPSLFITDLGSSNGTLVENNSLKSEIEVKMLPNERIIIGNYLIKPSVLRDVQQDVDYLDVEIEEVDIEPYSHTNGHSYSADDFVEELVEAQVSSEPSDSEPVNSEPVNSEPANSEAASILEEPGSVTEEDVVAYQGSAATEREVEIANDEAEPVPSEVVLHQSTPPAMNVDIDISELDVSDSEIVVNIDGASVLDLDFVAAELFSLSGTVLHKGKPLSGVTVDGGALGIFTTSTDGGFIFDGIAEGTPFALAARKVGFIFDVSAAEGSISGDVVRSITATELLQVRGTVLHKGVGLPGVRVDAQGLGTSETDADGKFVFSDVPEFTDYAVSFSKDKFKFEPVRIPGKLEKDQPPLESAARELFAISGKIIHRGQPLAGVIVDGGELGTVTTGSDGSYQFENVPEGQEYRLKVRKDKFKISSQK